MLGTFSFEPQFRSYFSFTMGPLNFSDFVNQSRLHFPPLSLSASPLPALSGAATAVGGRRAPPASPTAPRGTSATLWTHSPLRWTSSPLATPPRRAPRPPPRRRRGQPVAVPRTPISCAPQYQEQPRFTFPSLHRSLPAQNTQSTTAPPPQLWRARRRRGSAPPDILCPR